MKLIEIIQKLQSGNERSVNEAIAFLYSLQSRVQRDLERVFKPTDQLPVSEEESRHSYYKIYKDEIFAVSVERVVKALQDKKIEDVKDRETIYYLRKTCIKLA